MRSLSAMAGVAFALVLSTTLMAAESAPASTAGAVTAWLGGRTIASDLAEDAEVDANVAAGLQLDLGAADWPIRPAVGVAYSWAESDPAGIDVDLSLLELTAGVQGYLWGPRTGIVEPGLAYGAGLAWVSAEIEGRVPGRREKLDDDALGLYAQLGILLRIGDDWLLGAMARYTWAESSGRQELDDIDLAWDDEDLGGIGGGLVFGYTW